MSERQAADRLAREREFHNRPHGRDEGRFYGVLTAAHERYDELVLAAAQGRKKVLEIGCGEGAYAIRLAARTEGSSVLGIDVSDGRIAAAEANARGTAGVAFEVMDAEHLEIPDGSLDVACGGAILHHLDVDQTLREIARTLKANGRAFFLEPLGHNPLINLYRTNTPGDRTTDEHPLLMRDLRLAERHFGACKAEYFHLLSLLALPLARHERSGRAVAKVLEPLDRGLFAVLPPVRRYAWIVVLSLGAPRAAPG